VGGRDGAAAAPPGAHDADAAAGLTLAGAGTLDGTEAPPGV